MALTAEQEAKVRHYLGWSARFHQSDSRLEQAISALATTPEDEALVIAEIAACEDVDTKLTAAHARLKASVVGSITLNQKELRDLRSEGQRHVGRIASTLGVEVRHDVFSGGKFRSFATHGGLTGGGNYGLHG